MKYHAIYPKSAGQLAGRHSFRTARELSAFLQRMKERGLADKPTIEQPTTTKGKKK